MVQVIPEATPNPNAVKFTLDCPAVESGSRTFREGTDPASDPLGAALFGLGGVTNVFTVSNFVSVTKDATTSWVDLAPKIAETIQAHFS